MRNPETQSDCEYEVVWPDGSVYSNRFNQARLTEDEARMTAPRIGGTWRRAADEEA